MGKLRGPDSDFGTVGCFAFIGVAGGFYVYTIVGGLLHRFDAVELVGASVVGAVAMLVYGYLNEGRSGDKG